MWENVPDVADRQKFGKKILLFSETVFIFTALTYAELQTTIFQSNLHVQFPSEDSNSIDIRVPID